MRGSSLRRRRVLSLLAAGATTGLAGCSRLFTEPEDASTATPTTTVATTPTATPTATATTTPTATPTATAGSVPLRITGYGLSFEAVEGEFTAVDVAVDLKNEGGRDVDLVELRVALVYAPDTEDRTVAVDFVADGFEDANDDVLGDGETVAVRYRTRFPSDGRADGSTDPEDFALRFRVTRVEYA